MKRFIIFLTLISITLSACGTSSATVAKSARPREKNPQVSETDLQSLVDGNNAFALDLYQALRSKDGNLIVSPFSISLALAMTYSGASGETETQMANVLGFGPQEQTHPAFNALDLALEDTSLVLDKEQEPMQLSIANSVWAEKTFSFLPEFLDALSVHYGAGIRQMDFLNAPEPSRIEINNWVSDETQDRINDLLTEGTITPDTKMVLVNAIYFKADWLTPFDANDSYDGAFTLLDGSQVTVPMMSNYSNYSYAAEDGFALVELPYAGGTAVMDVLVPDAGRFDEVEARLTSSLLDEALKNLTATPLDLQMPKFEYESAFMLSDALSDMGMPQAFDEDRADFSGMTGKRDLYIADVIHKAFVKVDEKGTEAAAATAVIMEGVSAVLRENILTIDRPFFFFIRDAQNGQILFIGRVLNPQ